MNDEFVRLIRVRKAPNPLNRIKTVGPRLIGPIGTKDYTFVSQVHIYREEITLKTIILDLKMLTFIDGEPLKAGVLLRGSTVCEIMGHWPLRGRYLVFHICLF